MNAAQTALTQTETRSSWNGAKPIPLLTCLSIGLALWFAPVPSGLDSKTWHLFAIFVTTIIAIIAKPMPIGGLAILALACSTLTGTLTIQQALSSFSSKIVWLILIAFLIARGFIKTGLGSRIAYHFISLFGKSTLGLSYGLVLTEFVLAPFIPSNTARGAGIVYPIVASLNTQYGSRADDGTADRIGAFLVKICFQANLITSAMFMTAMAANPLIVSLASKAGIEITWTSWALAAIVPGAINLLISPLAIYALMRPEIKGTPEAPKMALEKLREMGGLKLDERCMLVTFGLLLFLWVFGKSFGIDASTAALGGLSLLLLCGVLSWDDILSEKNAWNTFIWLASLLMLAHFLTEFGMISWFSSKVEGAVAGFNPWVTTAVLVSVYFVTHYFFASMTAHVTSMYSALLVVCLAAGAPAMATALMLGFVCSLCAGTTHYGTGTAPVYFGTGFISASRWWKIGALLCVMNIVIWAVVGALWWKVLGLW